MKRTAVAVLVACAMASAASLANAADAPPAQAAAAKPAAAAASGAILIDEIVPQKSRFPEPAIERTVIEDRGTRIDELRVRGQLQKVTVSPKGGAPGYEVLTTDDSQVIGADPGTSRGSTGKRVWNVLRSDLPGRMAVYTEVSFDEAAALIDGLDIGALETLAPCAGGIENTNYFADTASGRYVLTVFERLGADELPFYLHLMKHLAERDLPVPRPHAGSDGSLLLALKGKPAAVVDRLPGEHHLAPDAGDCASLGAVLARMHLATRDFAPVQPNLRGLAWWNATVPVVVGHLDPAAASMMQDELDYQRHLAAAPAYATLPRGAIHGDLFRDNVMFQDGALTGVFDFYFAGVDTLLYDLAVALNDWCSDLASGELVEDRAEALVAAYAALRPLESAEVRLLPALMRAAAFRFWLSRVWDAHLPRDAVVLTAHDPGHFERILAARRETPWHPRPSLAAAS